MYFETIQQMKRSLGQLDKWLEAAQSYAKTRGFDVNNLMSARLAPDQLPFTKQVQIACDNAKYSAARLSGKAAPSQPDDETTVEQLRARVRWTIAHLETYAAADFEGAATRAVTQPRWEGRVMDGSTYVFEYGFPNFFFHLVHAYALLRHNGVPLGKADYLGQLSMRQP